MSSETARSGACHGGEFIGGCDIAVELYEKGELQKKLGEAGVL